MKFILVNGRTPRLQCFCSLCCEPIGETYLREISTKLSYCDHTCYVGHRKLASLKRSKSRDGANMQRILAMALPFAGMAGIKKGRDEPGLFLNMEDD